MARETVSVPADVRAYAARQGVEGHLPAVLEAAAAAFPRAAVRLSVEADWEDEALRVIGVTVGGLTSPPGEVNAATDHFYQTLFAQLPPPATVHFRLVWEFAR